MVATALLLILLVIATATDVQWRKIYNWTTYPGMLIAFAVSAIATLAGADTTNGTDSQTRLLGIIPLQDSFLGFFACGAVMVVCYVFFPGGVGGGDIKLVAMIGAFLGAMSGLEAMLWTFVFGACMALITLIWKYGLWTLISRTLTFLLYKLRLGAAFRLSEPERQPLKTDLFLSPSALLAVIMVRFRLIEWL